MSLSKSPQSPLDLLVNQLLDMPPGVRDDLSRMFSNVARENQYREITDGVTKIQNDPHDPLLTKSNALRRVRRFVEASCAPYVKNGAVFTPILPCGTIVKVKFTGVGGEHNEDHYGIVWQSKKNRDHILMIPTTSYKENKKHHEHYFNIGSVGFLNGETIAMIDQMTAISRKRIMASAFENPQTGNFESIQLDPEQINRIRDGIRVVCLNQATLYSVIFNSNLMPELLDPNEQYRHLFRPIIVNNMTIPGKKLVYHLVDNTQVLYEIKWHQSNVSRTVRKGYLENWRDAVGTPRVTRASVIQQAYRNIQGTYLPGTLAQ